MTKLPKKLNLTWYGDKFKLRFAKPKELLSGTFENLCSSFWPIPLYEYKRKEKIITYCAGCCAILNKAASVCHVIDLIFEPQNAISGRAKVYHAPMTYLNRILLKRRLKKNVVAAVSRERVGRDNFQRTKK
jgi:hypothetical protein